MTDQTTTRTVTPEEAARLRDEATPRPWRENSEEDRDEGACGDITAAYIASENNGRTYTIPVVVDDLRWNKEGDGRLIAAAPDLAATVASEPERIAAAVAEAERRGAIEALWAAAQKFSFLDMTRKTLFDMARQVRER